MRVYVINVNVKAKSKKISGWHAAGFYSLLSASAFSSPPSVSETETVVETGMNGVVDMPGSWRSTEVVCCAVVIAESSAGVVDRSGLSVLVGVTVDEGAAVVD